MKPTTDIYPKSLSSGNICGHKNEPKNKIFGPVLTFSKYFNKNCSITYASSCMSSPVKNSTKVDKILISGQKITQKQPKMTVSTGIKTFEILKLENYRSDVGKTCTPCVLP